MSKSVYNNPVFSTVQVGVSQVGPQGPPGPICNLDDLLNVETDNKQNAQVVKYNSSNGEWNNGFVSATEVSGLLDGGFIDNTLINPSIAVNVIQLGNNWRIIPNDNDIDNNYSSDTLLIQKFDGSWTTKMSLN